MYDKATLVTLVVLTVVFQQGFGLSCFDCFSYESWEQCDKGGQMKNCTEKFGKAKVSCIKAVRYKLNQNKQEEWTFMKRCFETRKCNKEFCYLFRDGAEELEGVASIGCNVDCCDEDWCNAANKHYLSFYELTFISLASTSLVIFSSST